MQRPLFLPQTSLRPDLVGFAHEDCAQFLLSPDPFLWSNIHGISYLHTSRLPVSMFLIDTIFGIIKAFVDYFRVSLLLV